MKINLNKIDLDEIEMSGTEKIKTKAQKDIVDRTENQNPKKYVGDKRNKPKRGKE